MGPARKAAMLLKVKPRSRPSVSLAVRRLVRDLARRLPELAHVRASRILVVAGEARGLSRATIGPAPGALAAHGRRGAAGRGPTLNGKPVLYVMTLRPLWFVASTPEERVATVIHELYHLSARFDGRLHAGRKHSALARHAYDRRIRRLFGRYLEQAGPDALSPFAYRGTVRVRMFVRRSGAGGPGRRGRSRDLAGDLFVGYMPLSGKT